MPKDRLNSPGSFPERSVGFSNSDGRSLPDGALDSSPPLAPRLRTGADAFQFDALINGVSTLEPTSPYANSVPDSVSRQESLSPSAPQITHAQVPVAGLKRTVVISVLASVCVAVLTVWFLTHRPSTSVKPQPLTTAPGDSTLADIKNAFTRRGMPDPDLSPGAVSPGGLKTAATASIAVPDAVQREVLTSYGINPDDKRFQICYVVPPALNGTNDVKNLFPATPWFRGLKRRLDARLTGLVLNKKLSLAQAQEELTSDWIRAVHRYPVRNYGYNSSHKAKQVEKNTIWGK